MLCQGIFPQKVFVMDTQEIIRPGRQARLWRKDRIKTLLKTVKGCRGWRPAFIEEHPAFDSAEGASLLHQGVLGKTDDPDLLAALEIWIPKILESKPDWLQKTA